MNKKTDPVLEALNGVDNLALLKVLESGGDPNIRDRIGRTPLVNAVIDARLDLVDTLLRFGADVNIPDSRGYTPLHYAAQSHLLPIVSALISAGADVESRDSFGNTPLFRAVFESRGRGEVIHELIGAGADQHARNSSGVSPRDLAASIANFDVLSLLPDS